MISIMIKTICIFKIYINIIIKLDNLIKFNFSLETLTPITGKPTNTTLQLLQRQLFTNARSVPSARGGGLHGHLAILLSDANYIACVGVAFLVPAHPGPPPVAVGTAAAVSVALRRIHGCARRCCVIQ